MRTVDHVEIPFPPSVLASLERGETVALGDSTHTLAFLVPAKATGGPRPYGLAEGEFTVPATFNDPDPEIEAMFYGES